LVYWITEYLGTKAVNDELRDNEYLNTIIYDLRFLRDGKNNISLLRDTITKLIDLYEFCINNNIRLILQCQAGISRSNAFATFLIGIERCLSWNKALSIVKDSIKRTNINHDLEEQLKTIYNELLKGNFR
jgi:predicted protein tyrosine phosphatase